MNKQNINTLIIRKQGLGSLLRIVTIDDNITVTNHVTNQIPSNNVVSVGLKGHFRNVYDLNRYGK